MWASILLVFLIGGCARGLVADARGPRQKPQAPPPNGFLCALENLGVTESSGIALSRRAKGVYWTHNDSGDGPNLYAFDEKGRDLGTYTLAGVTAVDWEDMSGALIAGKPYLYVGDVGDNLRQRREVFVYRIPEPRVLKGRHTVSRFETYRLKYPDGPHNCETVIVTPRGDIQLVVKSADGVCGVYHADAPSNSGSYTLRRLGEFTLKTEDIFDRLATGGDMSTDGRRVVVRTYRSALLWDSGDVKGWFKKGPARIALPFEVQGEAVCFDRGRLLTTTEGHPCRVSYVKLRERR